MLDKPGFLKKPGLCADGIHFNGFRKERIPRLWAWLLLYPLLSKSVVVFSVPIVK